MLRKILSHVRSHSVAYVALFFALSGTAIAAKGITGKQIRNNSVTGKDVKESSLAVVGAGVVMARINDNPGGIWFGAPTGLTASSVDDPSSVQMISPSVNLKLRDLQVYLARPPGAGASRGSGVAVGGNTTAIGCETDGAQTSCSAPGPFPIPAGSLLSVYSSMTFNGTPSDVLVSYRLTP
jgi:hypothetical protein